MPTPSLLLAGWVIALAAPADSPPPAPATPPALLPGERQFNDCLRLPVGRKLRVILKPETEITEVIGWIASVTCKGFIVAGGLQLAGRKVTVFSPDYLTAPEAYRLFLSLLETAQLAVEPAGRFLRIIEASKSPRALLPLYGPDTDPGEGPDRDAEVITRVVRLAHADPTEIAAILQGYRGEQGTVVAYPPAGTLILTDRAATLDRLLGLLATLDVPGDDLRLWTLPARNLNATELAQTLSELAGIPSSALARPGAGGSPAAAAPGKTPGAAATTGLTAGVTRLLPDERTGRILVVATEAAFARLASLAARLDVPTETRAARVHAYRCRHADCDGVAGILASLAGISVTRGPAPEGGKARPGAVPAAAAPGPAASADRREGPAFFAGEVRVTSDPSANALLVLSSLEDFRALRRLIEEIDVPRKQVFIEASIMEVVRRKDRQVGVAYHGGRLTGSGGAQVGGFNAASTLLLDQDNLGAALVGLSGLAVGAPLTGIAHALGLGADQVPSLGAFIHLLQQDDNVDLIANPHLLITNNHEGQLSVGERVPVQGAFTGTVNGTNLSALSPVVSINREDVALTLTLTPHVNDDGLIRLEIEQKMEELSGTGALGPTTTKRTASTTVFARDQQTIIIGGLTRERQSEAAQKVPVLGDIPLIGFLFRSTQKTVEKQNIILALTPYVIQDPADLARVLEAKLRDRREFIRLYGTEAERRLIHGPLGAPRTPGMLERINRAVVAQGEAQGESRRFNSLENPLKPEPR